MTILGDTVLEGTERFLLFIASGDADIGQSNSVVTILDDDEPVGGRLSLDNSCVRFRNTMHILYRSCVWV